MLRSTEPRTRLPAVALVAVLAAACGSAPTPDDGPLPRRVLLISLDTLRADHTGFGGYSKPTTPFLDSLAQRGVVFDNHFANSNCTLPSHATMLTGLHYPSHGVRPSEKAGEDLHVLPSTAVTLAERFQEAGYFTAAFTSHGAWLNAEYGFDQGFDHFVSRWCAADQTIADYLELVDERPSEQSFTFLHFFDIHSDSGKKGPCLPYESSAELVQQFAGDSPPGFTGCTTTPGREGRCQSKYLSDLSMKIEPLPDEHLAYLVGLYDAGIRWLDDKLRGLFAELERRGQLENTLVVITADHGESFFEHETMLHDTHHDEVAKVPLLLVFPRSSGVAPRRIQALTQSTDLASTILDLCGLEPIGQVPSLAPAIMLNEEPADGLVLFHGHITIGRDAEGEYKYIKLGGRKPSVFNDREADPGERHNLIEDEEYKANHAERLLAAHTALVGLFDDCKDLYELLSSTESGRSSKLSAERIRELKALGYLGEDDPPEGEDEPETGSQQ
jgi:arylsulfatase A-like enzyme